MNVSRYVKVALFFITLGTAGSAYIIISADGLSDFNTKSYEVTLADATGLSSRSKIYLAGVAVGRVRSITLTGNEARLQVSFLKNVEIREGARLSRKSSSILGTAVLNLEPGDETSPFIAAGGRISADRESSDITAALGTVQNLGEQISQVIKEFQENQLALLAISLENFNSITQKVNLQSDAEMARISRILESLAVVSERIAILTTPQAELENGGPMADVFGTLENIRGITDDIRRGQGNVGQALYDDKLYASLLVTMQQIEEAVGQLRTALDTINTVAHNAGHVVDNAGTIVERAVGMGMQVDTHGGYNVLAGQIQAGAALRLTPASNDRWYKIGVTSVPNGYSTRTITETLDASGDRVKYEDATETKYSFAINAEIARRYGFFTFRGGLFENTAGLGLDFQPFKWASLSGEVFDFKTGEKPNLRGTLTVYPFFDPDSDKPWNWIYLKGGIDNSLNSNRDYFIGGGIRFADREIKGLVGLLPAMNN
ncbi:MAG TPA: MCE family protein [Treponema sp.]|nr:MCE family protein [Treponema sp.]